jgi:hypothetical protein
MVSMEVGLHSRSAESIFPGSLLEDTNQVADRLVWQTQHLTRFIVVLKRCYA